VGDGVGEPPPGSALRGDGPIVVLASGPRCGSTLLQRVLNSHPDILVWGEGGGFATAFAAAFAGLRRWAATYDGQRVALREAGSDAFVANALPDDDELDDAAAAMLRALFADPAVRRGRRRWGFKETRGDAGLARFLRQLMPGARVIHLTRNPADVLRSLSEWERDSATWSRDLTAAALADWARVNASFRADPRAADLLLRYEEVVTDPAGTLLALGEALAVDPAGLDPRVFGRRLRWDGEEAAPATDAAPPLADHHRRLLATPPLPDLAAAFGYDLGPDLEREAGA
jgi:hypothetical protein